MTDLVPWGRCELFRAAGKGFTIEFYGCEIFVYIYGSHRLLPSLLSCKNVDEASKIVGDITSFKRIHIDGQLHAIEVVYFQDNPKALAEEFYKVLSK